MKESPRRYASAAAFRVALETRLKAISKAEGMDLQRLRRQVSFDRLLARLFAEKNAPWLLKGGYAMELRLRTARTTKDIDISLPAQVVDVFDGDVVKLVQQSARIELADFFTFVIGESQLDLNAAPQGGARYPVVASIAGRVFTKFHLDVGIGDAVVQPTELIEGRNWLDFAGIPAAMLMAISKEQQFAEKFHAATPRLVQQPGERPCGHGITGSSANNGQVPPPPSDFSDIQHSRNAPDSSQSAGTACLLDSPISCPRTGVSY
jgi:hypothetical protein